MAGQFVLTVATATPEQWEAEEECSTPTATNLRLPQLPLVCPPAPKKQRRWQSHAVNSTKKFFNPPNLEAVFAAAAAAATPTYNLSLCADNDYM